MDNKTKILDSALELFHARGYDSVGVQEIAEMAGVSMTTVYNVIHGNAKKVSKANQ